MEAEYETFILVWCEREIEVRHQENWLNTCYWHVELRCSERLPVTETGYRSHFVPAAEFANESDVRTFVESWLDEAALSPAWQQYLADSRQLKLF